MATSDQSKTEYYGDQATAEDLLGFREHAERLADKISRFDPNLPMVVGIEGKWGEGKTSFLLMMEAYWRQKNKLAPEWPGLCKGWWLPCHWKALVKSVSGFLFGSQLECEQTQASPTHWLDPSNQLNKMEPVKNSGLIVFKFETLGNWILDLRGKLPREDRKIHLIKFDPWWFSGKEKLLERFLDEIKAKEPFYALLAKGMLSGLKGGFDKHNRYWLKIFSSAVVVAFASSRFTDLALLISREVTVPTKDELQTSIEIVSILSAVLAILFFMLIGGVVEKLLNFILPTDMEKKRARLERKLRTSPVQRIIIVDDIDRLPDDELQELFRVIKSVAAMPNIVYVLLYDRTAVSGVLDKLHANRGEQFLEKIVQLPHKLPIPTKTANRNAAYFIFSSLPAIGAVPPTILKSLGYKESLKQLNVLANKEHEKGLKMIVDTLIPNLRQAKRIANIVQMNYSKDIQVHVLLFVFLEAIKLHSGDMWLKLCSAMTNYKKPLKSIIAPDVFKTNDDKSAATQLNKGKEWMIECGLINKKYEPCTPFAEASQALIECIAYFTGLNISKHEKEYYGELPFYVPKNLDVDDQLRYLSDVFGKYLQTRLDESRLSVECIQEELLTLSNIDEVIEFIVDRQSRFGDLSINTYDIRFYLRRLTYVELVSQFDPLYKLARLIAGSAESICLYQKSPENTGWVFKCLNEMLSSFLELQYTRQTTDLKEKNELEEQEKKLCEYIRVHTPVLYFYRNNPERSSVGSSPAENQASYIEKRKAILSKYQPEQALRIFLKEDIAWYEGWAVFERILLATTGEADNEQFSSWLNGIPESNSDLDGLLLKWMVRSLHIGSSKSQLPLQPKLAHLIEPLKRELESKGDDVALENLKLILERNSNKTNL